MTIELTQHLVPLLCVLVYRALWHLEPEVVQNALFSPSLDYRLQDPVRHKRHRYPFGEVFANDFEHFIGLSDCLARQYVPLLGANLRMLCQVMPEVIAPCGSSLFDNLVIAAAIDFVIVKRDPVKGFQKPAVLTAELVGKGPRLQGVLVAVAAYLDVLIPAGEWKVG